MLEPAQYVVMRLPYFGLMRKWFIEFWGTRAPQAILLVLGVLFSYCVGFLDGALRYTVPITVVEPTYNAGVGVGSPGTLDEQAGVVASKNGTTFYYPWCSGRNRIKPENERWFRDSAEALKYGLKPAKNCLGL